VKRQAATSTAVMVRTGFKSTSISLSRLGYDLRHNHRSGAAAQDPTRSRGPDQTKQESQPYGGTTVTLHDSTREGEYHPERVRPKYSSEERRAYRSAVRQLSGDRDGAKVLCQVRFRPTDDDFVDAPRPR
jgi:hypothetical protein